MNIIIAVDKESGLWWIFGRHGEIIGRIVQGEHEWVYQPLELYRMTMGDLNELKTLLEDFNGTEKAQ